MNTDLLLYRLLITLLVILSTPTLFRQVLAWVIVSGRTEPLERLLWIVRKQGEVLQKNLVCAGLAIVIGTIAKLWFPEFAKATEALAIYAAAMMVFASLDYMLLLQARNATMDSVSE